LWFAPCQDGFICDSKWENIMSTGIIDNAVCGRFDAYFFDALERYMQRNHAEITL
jgi:hypothetical protein